MWSHSCLLFVAPVLTLCAVLQGASDASSLVVRLAVAPAQYSVGQPVELGVTAQNTGGEDIQAWGDVRADQIHVYIARDGEEFRRYTPGEYDHVDSERLVEPLPPRACKVYAVRVLYTFFEKETTERRRLAFEEPGAWLVKVRYPLYPNRQMYESNTIRIQLKAPQGVDARVWQRINRPEFLYFLQWGLTPGDNHDVVRDAVHIVRTVPTSSYHDALRWSLLHYYRHETHGGLRGMDAAERALLEEVRKVLGLPDPAAGPFPEDKRLEAKVTCYFGGGTPLEDAFKRVSEAGGVPLRLAPEMRARIIYGTLQDKVLRKFMDEQDEYKARWVRDGDGYKLVPAPDEKPKPR